MNENKLNIVAISDQHGYLPENILKSDVMLIAGDVSPLHIQSNKPKMKEWFATDFKHWVMNLPVDKVFMVAGNHDFIEHWGDRDVYEFEQLFGGKLKYLVNETFDYNDNNGCFWNIFGTPYCHIFGNWPFMRSEEYMEEKFKEIPEYIDVIISHDPPHGIGQVDQILQSVRWSNHELEHIGNEPLSKRISEVKYKLLVCGHIHSGDHETFDFGSGKCVNVSLKDERYEPTYEPFYFELCK